MAASAEPAPANPLFTIFLILAMLAVWGLVQDAINTADGGSIDLRNRITGVRLAAEGRDPYFYKWTRREDERFCDLFNAPASPVSHTTVTPTTLTTFYPLKNLPYRVSQCLWFLIQYAALGLGFYAWCRASPRPLWLWAGMLTCLFCLSPHWRLHVDRGQSYVLYAALFLAIVSLHQKPRSPNLSPASLATALLALLRPTYGILLGVTLLQRRTAAFLATALGLLLWGLLPMLVGGVRIWNDYFKAMAIHAQLYLSQTKFPPARFSATDIIEGLSINTLGGFARIPFADTSLYKLISFHLSPAVLLGSWASLAAASSFLMFRRRGAASPSFWWVLSAWLVIGDFLLPAYR